MRGSRSVFSEGGGIKRIFEFVGEGLMHIFGIIKKNSIFQGGSAHDMYDKRNYSVYSYTDSYDEKSCMRLNPVKQRNMLAFCKQI